MLYTGFADEAAPDLDGQIKATKELGWSNIESRNIDGMNVHDLPMDQFEIVEGKLKDAGVSINCFGSAVANWSKDVTTPEGIQSSIDELERAIVRMQRLGTKNLRGMSYKIAKDLSPHDVEIENLVITNLRELVKRCADAGIMYLHENCMNFGGQSHEHSLKLVEKIDSPNFKLIFDTGNPTFTDLRLGDKPYKKQSSWEFYQKIKEHIAYIHIKDATFVTDTDGIFPKAKFTFPGEGDGDVRRIVKDLLTNGFTGPFSMEPHLSVVFHETDDKSDDEKSKKQYSNYVEYGQRFIRMVEDIQLELRTIPTHPVKL